MIECPKKAGSSHYNYRGYHSTALLARCDAQYCFTFVDFDHHGSTNDAGILQNCDFGKAFENLPTRLQIPKPNLVGDKELPFVLLGDDIFPLKPWLMKPFPGTKLDESQRIYNYRLSRARRTIENAFGILSAKWRIFRRPITASTDLVEKITKACICLHNYLRLTENPYYIPAGFVDSEDNQGNFLPGTWRQINAGDETGMQQIERIGGNHYGFDASVARLNFKEYFNSNEGKLSWQLEYINDCGTKYIK